MTKKQVRRRKEVAPPTPFEEARDELFQHIIHCGVIGSAAEDQSEWFGNTMAYLAERYHELGPSQIAELRTLGERFAQPPVRKTEPAEPETSDAASAA
jgi:hypothetical protein